MQVQTKIIPVIGMRLPKFFMLLMWLLVAVNSGAQTECKQALNSQWEQLRNYYSRKFVMINSVNAESRAHVISRLLALRLTENQTPKLSFVVTTDAMERSHLKTIFEEHVNQFDQQQTNIRILELDLAEREAVITAILSQVKGASTQQILIFTTDRDMDDIFKNFQYQIQGLQGNLIAHHLSQLVYVSPAREKIIGVARYWEQLFTQKDVWVFKVITRDHVSPKDEMLGNKESGNHVSGPNGQKLQKMRNALATDDLRTLETLAKDLSFKQFFQNAIVKGLEDNSLDSSSFLQRMKIHNFHLAQLHAWGIVVIPNEAQIQLFGAELNMNPFSKWSLPVSIKDKEKAALALVKLKTFIVEKSPELIQKKLAGKSSEATWFKYLVQYYPTTNQQINWRSFFTAEQLEKLDRAIPQN